MLALRCGDSRDQEIAGGHGMNAVADQAAEYLRAQAAEPPPAPMPTAERVALEQITAAKDQAVRPTADYLAAKAALTKRPRKDTNP